MPSPAQDLHEARSRLSLEPLSENSSEYVDLSAARGTKCLAKLANLLRECATSKEARCHLAFVGHRGSGKSTELLRMEKDLSDVLFPVHLFVDSTLESDADYPDLFLWLVENIAQKLHDESVPFDDKHTKAVADWFAAVTEFDTSGTVKTVEVAGETSASVGTSWMGTGFKVLASLKSAIKGSKETREEMRREIKKRADDLVQLVNNFLAAASVALAAAGKPSQLLIVQDNLDRLSREAAIQLFKDSGEIIQKLNAACVWTPPVGSLLAPFHIGRVFTTFPMPMISVRKRKGKTNPVAVNALTELVAKRLAIELTFDKPALVTDLIHASGGSVRELLRLIDETRLNALVEDHTVIRKPDVQATVKQAALMLQNSLTPGNIYLPILAEISLTKNLEADLEHGYSAEAVNARRDFFHSLIAEGAVLAYNGEENWFDVNPVLHVLRVFQEALATAQVSEA